MKANRLREGAGFSFIELIITVAVLGILTALGLIFFQGFQAQARQAAVDATAQNGARAVTAADSQGGNYREALLKLGSEQIGVEFLNNRTGDITAVPSAPYCILAYNKQHKTPSGDPQFYSIAGTCESQNPELPNDNNEGRSRAQLTTFTLRCEEDVAYPAPLEGFKGTLIWSDGSSSYQSSGAVPAKELKAGQEYTLKAYGTYSRLGSPQRTQVSPVHSCLRSVDYMGAETGVTSLREAFTREQVLESVASPPASVTTLSGAFRSSLFNGSLAHWDVSHVEDFSSLFTSNEVFNQPLNSWDTRSATRMSNMFSHARSFNQPLDRWNTAKVITLSNMFFTASRFNQPIDSWNTSSVKQFNGMFAYATDFNQPLGSWDMKKAEGLANLFSYKNYNQDITSWQVESATDLSSMFASNKTFNQDISHWNVSKVTHFDRTFYGATAFSHNINAWNTESATSMNGTFAYTSSFNQPLDNWKTGKVKNMDSMFLSNFSFNQDISGWDTGSVTNMNSMFEYNRALSYSLRGWNVAQVTTYEHFNRYGSLPAGNLPNFR